MNSQPAHKRLLSYSLTGILLVGLFILTAAEQIPRPAAASGALTPRADTPIVSIVFAEGEVDGNPVNPTDRFAAGTEVVYVFLNYDPKLLKRGDQVGTFWSRDGQVVDQRVGTLSGMLNDVKFLATLTGGKEPAEGTVWFLWSQEGPLTAGSYRLDVTVNGEPAASGTFVVEDSGSGESTPSSAGILGEITFGRGESAGEPVGPSDRFNAGIETVYAFFEFEGLDQMAKLGGAWYQSGQLVIVQETSLADIFNNRAPGRGTLWFYLNEPNGFQPGHYTLELSVEGQNVRHGEFVVQPDATAEPLIASVSFAAAVEDFPGGRVPVGSVGFRFPVTTDRVYAVVDHFNMIPGASWSWRLTNEGMVVDEGLELSWDGEPEGFYLLPLAIPGEPGVYDLDIFVAGRHSAAASFVVGAPGLAQNRVLAADDFSDPDSGWGTARNEFGEVAYQDGRYILSVRGEEPAWGTGGEIFGDVVVEVSVAPLDSTPQGGESLSNYGYYGVVARYQDSKNFYAFVLSPDGQFGAFHLQDGRLVLDHPWAQAPQGLVPHGLQARQFRVLSEGSVLRYYVGGVLVAWADDVVWSTGQSGVIVGALGPDPVTIAFDDWRVWRLRENETLAGSPQPGKPAIGAGLSSGPDLGSVTPSPPDVASVLAESPGIRLETAAWVPARDPNYGGWGVVQAGDPPDERVQWTQADDELAVPPGRYDVYWVQDYDHQSRPLLLASGVEVREDAVTRVAAGSGIRLEVASWVPARDSGYGWWGAVRAGGGTEDRVNWTNSEEALLVPPGRYDVYWVQDYDHQSRPLLLTAGVELGSGELVVLWADAGIRLSVPPGAPLLDPGYGWWGASPTGGGPNQRVNWVGADLASPLLLPPGTYDIFWKQNYGHNPEMVEEGVEVEQGELIEVEFRLPG